MTFAQREDESLCKAWEHIKDLLRLCPHHGLQQWMLVQAFYNGATQSVRSTIDAAAGGTFMNKTEDEAYNLIEEIALNNYQWSNQRSQPKRVGGKLELNSISMRSTKVDAMSQKLERLNVNSISTSTYSLSCEICGSVYQLTVNCQVRNPFTQDASDSVNYVNNFNPKPTNDPFSNTYNPSWRNQPNFSYRSNAPSMPQMNFRPPREFQRLPYP